MGQKIIVILFFVFLLGVLIYVVNSGLAANTINSFVVLLQRSTSMSSSTSFLTPGTGSGQSSGGGGYGTGSGSSAAGGSGWQSAPVINPSDIPTGFTAAQLSPYFHQVRFGGVSAGAYGQITLSAYFTYGINAPTAASSTVDVTGWRITAQRGGEYVPQAINLYDPSGLTAPSDIILRNGDYVNLYSQPGPFNLRLNECIGYIGNQNKQFNPQLPGYCPTPDRTGVSNFTGACQNYVYSIGSCQVPDLNNPQIPFNDYACRDYIANNFSYRACYDAHVRDAQFLSNAVWVWTGSSPLDPYHDKVYLYDRAGLLVDAYSY